SIRQSLTRLAGPGGGRGKSRRGAGERAGRLSGCEAGLGIRSCHTTVPAYPARVGSTTPKCLPRSPLVLSHTKRSPCGRVLAASERMSHSSVNASPSGWKQADRRNPVDGRELRRLLVNPQPCLDCQTLSRWLSTIPRFLTSGG